MVIAEQGQQSEDIALKWEITDRGDGIEVTLRAEMVDGDVDHGTGERLLAVTVWSLFCIPLIAG